MNDELQLNNITVSSVELTSWGLKIKDEKGLIYNISRYKKDTQEETVAYQYISKLPNNGMGMKLGMKFATVRNSQGGESRYVRIIGDWDNSRPVQTQPTYHQESKSDDAEGKVRHGFSIEAYKLGKQLNPETVAEINKWVNYVMSGSLLTKPSQVDEEDSIDISDIPF
jgi:hypothetical protein